MKHGLFVGLTTLDFIYLTQTYPHSNEKVVAIDQTIAAGGPATNAAVAFSSLGDRATLYSIIGQQTLASLIHRDLEACKVEIRDLKPLYPEIPPISSIIVSRATGERTIISRNATRIYADPKMLPENPLQNVDIVLIDGHQIAVSEVIARQAKQRGIPVVVDGGSWKEGFERILPWVDHAIVSADFYPPDCGDRSDVFSYLQGFNIPHIAITDGERSIEYVSEGNRGSLAVTPVKTVDTLGAGDIFHGAFCHFILGTDFVKALQESAKVAAFSVQFFGTRQWLRYYRKKVI